MGTLLWFVGVFTLLIVPSSGHLLGKDSVTPLIDYAVRLVDGPDISQGRLEMLIQGTWGTICDDGFDDLDAQVACYSLGFTEFQGTFQGNTYGPGTGPVYFSQFQCVGTEGVLDDCPHGALGTVGNCTNADDVSIACVGTGYPMRLVGGSVLTEGRLELQYRGVWGTICDDGFGTAEAEVACNSLGMGRQGIPIQNSFGEGTGPIVLDDLGCLGTEDNIGYCEHPPWGTHNCQHSEDAAVSCTSTVSSGPDVGTRLAGGPSPNEGRLEMYFAGSWGTVCDNGFRDVEAQVACSNLGFDAGQGSFLGNQYGPGTGAVYMDNVVCAGTEEVLVDCQHSVFGSSNCTNSQDVSIACVGATSYDVRLVGSANAYEGRVEIFYRGQWGTVCDDSFDGNAVQVVCNTLGYGYTGRFQGNLFGPGTGTIWLDDVVCQGSESNIGHCPHSPWGANNCQHSEDVSISCSSTTSTGPDVATRLAGGPSPNEGRLEMYFGGSWGTVCDNGFRDIEAQVACNNLGFDAGQGGFLGNQYGPGTGGVYMDNVVCTGTEEVLVDCQHLIFGSSNCTHSQDVSIACVGATSYDVRLAGSVNAYEGRVEIFYRGQWGTVCDDSFTSRAAQVVCNTLGYGYTGRFLGNDFGPGTGTIWLDDVVCDGSESNIGHCPHSPWGNNNCVHGEDASISCSPLDFAVRLIGGATANEGRIEAFINGAWGTACDTGFGPTEAAVACTSLGFDQGQGTFLGNQFGPGSGTILLDQVDCTGDELSLNECNHAEFGQTTCSHNNDVSISCVGTGYPTRLVGGIFPTDGRLEIFYRGVWGTVCDDAFTDVEAQVVCFGLGYPRGIGRFTGNSPGIGQIWLDDVVCGGYENNVGSCAHAFWGENNCAHTEDVEISCSTSTGTMYPVRLIGSDGMQAQNSGRLEYYVLGTWGTVCDPNFSDQDAQVACYSLGFNQFEGTYIGQAHGSGTGSLLLDNVGCTGTEFMIDDCPHSIWGSTNCDHTTDVSISCVGPWPAMPVRLVNPGSNSTNPTEGRLEIQYYGTWGTVCDDAFTVTDVRVACASLGFGYIGSLTFNTFGTAVGQIWLDEVDCIGDELNIGLCNHLPWAEHNCAHSEDVAISCV